MTDIYSLIKLYFTVTFAKIIFRISAKISFVDEENKFIIFEFSETRNRSVPNAKRKNFSGIFQTDGYSGYNQMRASENIITFGCWNNATSYSARKKISKNILTKTFHTTRNSSLVPEDLAAMTTYLLNKKSEP